MRPGEPKNATRRILHSVASRRMEIGVALLVSALVFAFHVQFMRKAGALWRDEAHTVALASQDSLAALWASLEHDSFPVLSSLVVRAWTRGEWATTDSGLRAFGCAVGVAILGSLWFATWLLGRRAPLVALVLVGLSPLMIRWGDSIRPHGLGIVAILLALGSIWRLTRTPGCGALLFALITAVASVQLLYPNAFLLLGICIGGAATCLRRSQWRRAGLVLGIGLCAALTLLPYIPLLRRAAEWAVVLQSPMRLDRIASALAQALGLIGPPFLWTWIGALALGAFVLAWRVARGGKGPSEGTELAIFCLVAIAIGGAAFGVFILIVPVQPWYFLPLMATTAACLDASLPAGPPGRAGRVAFAVIASCLAFQPVARWVEVRQTNIDLVATRLEQLSRPEDLIVVHPWYLGISFRRYYHGRAAWTTLPPLGDLSIHRFDLLKRQIASTDPIQPVLASITETLDAGGRVWFLQRLPRLRSGEVPRPLPPGPHPVHGWSIGFPMRNWSRRAAHLVRSLPTRRQAIDVSPGVPVLHLERVSLEVVVRSTS